MPMFLKQNTQTIVPMGPFVDATDGGTLETAIAFASGEANVIKHGAASVTDIGTNTWSAHLGGGYYNVTLTANNLNTLGMLVVEAHDTAARPVRREFMVIPGDVYDALVGGSILLPVNADEIDGNATSGMLSGTTSLRSDAVSIAGNSAAADNLSAGSRGLVIVTIGTGSSVTNIKTGLTEGTNDHYNGRTLTFITGTLAGQSTSITDYSGSSHDLTVVALTEAPVNGDIAVIN